MLSDLFVKAKIQRIAGGSAELQQRVVTFHKNNMGGRWSSRWVHWCLKIENAVIILSAQQYLIS